MHPTGCCDVLNHLLFSEGLLGRLVGAEHDAAARHLPQQRGRHPAVQRAVAARAHHLPDDCEGARLCRRDGAARLQGSSQGLAS